MTKKFKAVLMEKSQADLAREIKWLKSHIKARELVLAIKETNERLK